jgi:hypothetical protein
MIGTEFICLEIAGTTDANHWEHISTGALGLVSSTAFLPGALSDLNLQASSLVCVFSAVTS